MTAPALSVPGGPPRVRNRLAVVGDSVMQRNISVGTNLSGHDTRGAISWAQVYLGQRFDLVPISAVPGDRTDQVLGRLRTEILQYAPGIVLVECGPNDLFAQRYRGEIIGYLRQLYTTVLASNAVCVATTITPSVAFNTTNQTERHHVNKWIREFATATPGMVLCDWSAVTQDANFSNFAWISGYSPDNTHPSTKGAAAMGYALSKVLDPLFTKGCPFLPSTNFDVTNGVANSFMDSALGGWSFGGTSTNSFVARTDGIAGNWQQMVTTTSCNMSQNVFINGKFQAAKDYVYAACEMQSDAWTSVTDCRLTLLARDASATQLWASTDLNNSNSDTWAVPGAPYQPGLASTVVFRTPAFLLPPTTAVLVPVLVFTGNGTTRWSRVAIHRANQSDIYAA